MTGRFIRGVRNVARENWREEGTTQEEIDERLAGEPAELAAWGIAELVRRLNQVIRALNSDEILDSYAQAGEPPENALVLSVPIGTVLYDYSADGMQESIVIDTDEQSHVKVVIRHPDGSLSEYHRWMINDWEHHLTPESAIAAWCNRSEHEANETLSTVEKTRKLLRAGKIKELWNGVDCQAE